MPNRARFLEQFEGEKGEARLLAHLKVLYSKEHLRQLVAQIKEWRKQGLEGEVQRRLESYKRRMADLAWFMKQVKERFYPSFLRLCGLAAHGGCRYRG